MLGHATVAWPLAARTAENADFVIDGVPLPADASVALVPKSGTDLQRCWSGVWTGEWNGEIKHILLVERIGEDGAAGIVYALADDLHTGLRANWRIRRCYLRANSYRQCADVHSDVCYR